MDRISTYPLLVGRQMTFLSQTSTLILLHCLKTILVCISPNGYSISSNKIIKFWESKCNLLNVLVYSVIILAQQGSDIWRNKEKEPVHQTPTHSLAHFKHANIVAMQRNVLFILNIRFTQTLHESEALPHKLLQSLNVLYLGVCGHSPHTTKDTLLTAVKREKDGKHTDVN